MAINASSKLTEQFRLTPVQKAALKKLKLETVRDLLYYFPVRYGDTAETRNANSLEQGQTVVLFGKISNLKASKGFKTKITMADAYVEDETGKVHCVWFNQPYVAKMYTDGMLVRVEGKVSARRQSAELYLSNPKIEKVETLPTGVGDSLFGSDGETHTLYPVYPESRGISSTWIYHALQKIFKSGILESLVDPVPADILKKYNLPSLKTSVIWIHAPLSRDDALSARKRFSFEEIFFIQLERQLLRLDYRKQPTYLIETNIAHVKEFIKRFPFTATKAQHKAIETILKDMSGEEAMRRLLEGDVGSGKTAVAAASAYAVITAQPTPEARVHQVGFMCPTEILATQHFESFIQFFSYLPIQIGLITGSGCRKFPSKVNPKGWTDISRKQLLDWVAHGQIHVLVGTHALISKSVQFQNLSYAIIDEQHRFGVDQRAKMTNKSRQPHLLSMTATPIPRTLALTMYGDLDLTLLDESPAGRKPIITELVLPDKRVETYEKCRAELQAGRQMYVICPRIDEPDPTKEAAIIAKSVKAEAERLKRDVFPEYEIDILHSKMTSKDKDEVMQRFKSGFIKILCATSVVEVGVNVPNATVIIIEGAERFGLAQLHQLRGRVLRSTDQAYCYVFTETSSAKSIDRLNALSKAKNGFELSELDLAQRGAGQLGGTDQWGISDVGMEALKNLKMVEAARNEAEKLVKTDPTFAEYPELSNRLQTVKAKHLE